MSRGGEGFGRDRGSSLFSRGGVRRRDNEASNDGLSANRLDGLVGSADSIPVAPTKNVDAQQIEAEAADESAKPALVVTDPVVTKDEGPSTAEVGEPVECLDSVADMLALAKKVHDEYVHEGQSTRERLISEGHARQEQVVSEATAMREELLSTGQARYDEFLSNGEAKHDALIAEAEARVAEANAVHEHMITEARTRSTGMVAEAQEKRAEVLLELGSERTFLQKEIEELRASERDNRDRLKSYHEGQLKALVQTGPDETG